MCGFAGSVNFTTPPLATICTEMTETLHAELFRTQRPHEHAQWA